MHSYPLGDMVARIKNAYRAYHTSVSLPYSRLKRDLADVLFKQGYIKDYQIQPETATLTARKAKSQFKELVITLAYINKKPVMNEFKIISKPGVRHYVNNKKLPRALSGLGTVVISTAKGVMTAEEARKKGLGGELLCQIW